MIVASLLFVSLVASPVTGGAQTSATGKSNQKVISAPKKTVAVSSLLDSWKLPSGDKAGMIRFSEDKKSKGLALEWILSEGKGHIVRRSGTAKLKGARLTVSVTDAIRTLDAGKVMKLTSPKAFTFDIEVTKDYLEITPVGTAPSEFGGKLKFKRAPRLSPH